MILEKDGMVVGGEYWEEIVRETLGLPINEIFSSFIRNIGVCLLIRKFFIIIPPGFRSKKRFAALDAVTNIGDEELTDIGSLRMLEPFIDIFLVNHVPGENETGSLYFWGYR